MTSARYLQRDRVDERSRLSSAIEIQREESAPTNAYYILLRDVYVSVCVCVYTYSRKSLYIYMYTQRFHVNGSDDNTSTSP
jgi:hypothetical protein